MSDEQQQDTATPKPAIPKPPKPPAPSDPVLTSLQASVQFVVALSQDPNRSDSFVADLKTFSAGLIPAPPDVPNDDLCQNPTPLVAPACAQREMDSATAENVFLAAEAGAATTLTLAVNAWNLAVTTYKYALANGNTALTQTIKPSIITYQQAHSRSDSPSRAQMLYYTLEAASTAAVISYESVDSGAAGALAGAAGVLLTAYATYVTTVRTAAATFMNATASAEETFWNSVETSRDS